MWRSAMGLSLSATAMGSRWLVGLAGLAGGLGGGLAGCGDNLHAPPDASRPPVQFQTAPHAPMPRVLRHSGAVLSNLQLVTLTYEGYAGRDLAEHFGDAIVRSSWYTTVGAEYGVRAGTHMPPIRLGPPPATLTREDIANEIKQLITDGVAPRPPMTGNQLLYLIYIPPSVNRSADLDDVIGYHEMLTLAGGAKFPIVVVIDDIGDDRGSAAPSLTAAHQLINAVTNPYDVPNDGYYADPPMFDPWSLVRGEVADLCEGETPVMEGELALPRVYSDAAARIGKPPCTPMVAGDTWNDVTATPSTMQMVPQGSSVTFELTGWSTEEVADWSLRTRVADFSQLTEAQMQPELSDDTINNARTVTLTLHAPRNALRGAAGGVYVLSGENSRRWAVGFVVK
jgi:hypothetical protein